MENKVERNTPKSILRKPNKFSDLPNRSRIEKSNNSSDYNPVCLDFFIK